MHWYSTTDGTACCNLPYIRYTFKHRDHISNAGIQRRLDKDDCISRERPAEYNKSLLEQ